MRNQTPEDLFEIDDLESLIAETLVLIDALEAAQDEEDDEPTTSDPL